jgi:hypothetical protein
MTAEEYIKERDLLVQNYEKGNVSEDVFIKRARMLYAKRLPVYKNGGDGFIAWAEENVRVNAYVPGTSIKKPTYLADLSREPEPETGKSWWDLWCWQKDVCKQALVLREDGRLKHNLVVLCTERGEGKSFMAVLIVLWKFTNLPDQRIFLAANSKEQSSFAHREEIDKIIRFSPLLLALVGGESGIKQKEMAIYDSRNNKISFITTVSTFTGVLSNATGFTFSEFFQSAPDGKFFAEIYGSMRNTPNALGVIDSTVSVKSHRLYRIWENIQNKKPGTETQFFYYKCNPGADINKYYSPANTQSQLDIYKTTFTPEEFAMYFENTWESATSGLFSDTDIKISETLGVNGKVLNYSETLETFNQISEHKKMLDLLQEKKGITDHTHAHSIKNLESGIISTSSILSSLDSYQKYIPSSELAALGYKLNTDWCIGVGIDRSDPMSIRSGAQTILTCVAKGLPGSRSNPNQFMVGLDGEIKSPNYIYVLCGFYHSIINSAADIQETINLWNTEYNGIEGFASDKYGMQDLPGWLISQAIIDRPEIFQFSYQIQRQVFMMLYQSFKAGMFKKPRVLVNGVNEEDMLNEQLKHFCHTFNGKTGTFGSDEKSKNRLGVQDDAVDSLALAMYSLRMKGLEHFKPLTTDNFFGVFIPN